MVFKKILWARIFSELSVYSLMTPFLHPQQQSCYKYDFFFLEQQFLTIQTSISTTANLPANFHHFQICKAFPICCLCWQSSIPPSLFRPIRLSLDKTPVAVTSMQTFTPVATLSPPISGVQAKAQALNATRSTAITTARLHGRRPGPGRTTATLSRPTATSCPPPHPAPRSVTSTPFPPVSRGGKVVNLLNQGPRC